MKRIVLLAVLLLAGCGMSPRDQALMQDVILAPLNPGLLIGGLAGAFGTPGIKDPKNDMNLTEGR